MILAPSCKPICHFQACHYRHHSRNNWRLQFIMSFHFILFFYRFGGGIIWRNSYPGAGDYFTWRYRSIFFPHQKLWLVWEFTTGIGGILRRISGKETTMGVTNIDVNGIVAQAPSLYVRGLLYGIVFSSNYYNFEVQCPQEGIPGTWLISRIFR